MQAKRRRRQQHTQTQGGCYRKQVLHPGFSQLLHDRQTTQFNESLTTVLPVHGTWSSILVTEGKKKEKKKRLCFIKGMTVLEDNLILWFSNKQFTIPQKEFYWLKEIQVNLLLQKRDYFTCWTDFYTKNLILPQGSQHGFMKESSFHFIFLRCWFNIVLWKLQQCTVESKQKCNKHIYFDNRTENQKLFQFVQKKKTTLKQCPWNFIAFFHFYTWSSFRSVTKWNCVYVFYL